MHEYRTLNGQVTDKERSTNGLCCMSNGCITGNTNMYRIRSLNDHRTHLTSQVTDRICFRQLSQKFGL